MHLALQKLILRDALRDSRHRRNSQNSRHTKSLLPGNGNWQATSSRRYRLRPRRGTARLGAHQSWLWKFRSRLVRWKWMTHSVLVKLPDRPALSEHPNKAACSLRRAPVASNQQKLQTRERTSERWPHLFFLRLSWFSPLVELWLRVSLNDQGQATFRTNNGSDQSSTIVAE